MIYALTLLIKGKKKALTFFFFFHVITFFLLSFFLHYTFRPPPHTHTHTHIYILVNSFFIKKKKNTRPQGRGERKYSSCKLINQLRTMDEIWGSRLQVHSFEIGLACTTRTNGRGKLQIKMEVNELCKK